MTARCFRVYIFPVVGIVCGSHLVLSAILVIIVQSGFMIDTLMRNAEMQLVSSRPA